MDRRESIREHGLKLAQSGVPITEKAAVWFSTNPVYEATACKYGTTTLQGMLNFGLNPIRYVVDMALTNWAEHKKTSGIVPVITWGLEQAAKQVGSNPKEWYCSYEPVRKWLAVEAYQNGKWVELHADKMTSANGRKTSAQSKAASAKKSSASETGGKTKTKKLFLNKIWNENCLETLKRMPDCSIDLIVTSPPYDELMDYKGLTLSEFAAIAKELYRVLKPGGVIVWVVADGTEKGSETGTSFRQALYFQDLGLNIHDTMIYEKSGFSFPEKNRYHQAFEYMFILSKGKPKTFNPIKDRKNKYVGIHGGEQSYRGEFGMRYNIWRYANGGNHNDTYGTAHPAPMPEALARDMILSFSNRGEAVYDPFGGSGTTVVEAMLLGRKWIASEISTVYCKMIENRFKVAIEGERKTKKAA